MSIASLLSTMGADADEIIDLGTGWHLWQGREWRELISGGCEDRAVTDGGARVQRIIAWLQQADTSALGANASAIDATLDGLMTTYTGLSAANSGRLAKIMTLRDAGILARDGDAVVIVGS